MRIAWIAVILVSLVAVGACDRGAPAPAPAHEHGDHAHSDHRAPSPATAAATEQGPAGPRIETGSFLLTVSPSEPKYRVGKTGELEIALESRGPWHVNQEYPIRVDLNAGPGLKLEKKELLKDDAEEFGDEKVRFTTSLEPSATGSQDVRCDVSFAMCTDENCVLEKRTVAMQIDVE